MWSMEKKLPTYCLRINFAKKILWNCRVIHMICHIWANYKSPSRMDFIFQGGSPTQPPGTFWEGHVRFWNTLLVIKRNNINKPKFNDVYTETWKTSWILVIWIFPKIGVPQHGRFKMENLIKMDDLGVPLFLETPICREVPVWSSMHK